MSSLPNPSFRVGIRRTARPQYVWDVSPSVPGLQTGWPQIWARNFANSALYVLLDAGHQAGAASMVGRADGCARQPVGRQAIPPALL
jgi:hypothetical protein